VDRKVLSRSEIQKRQAKGAQVTEHPKLVESPALVAAINQLASAQLEATKHANQQMVKAIEALTRSINGKKMEGTDLSELIAAVAGLKSEATAAHEPVDYVMTASRDPQRHLIDMEKGVRFSAVPRRLDS
jgi:hypothetical protein